MRSEIQIDIQLATLSHNFIKSLLASHLVVDLHLRAPPAYPRYSTDRQICLQPNHQNDTKGLLFKTWLLVFFQSNVKI